MASQALYRQYRSQTFDELIGQEHVVQTLRNALAEGRIAHAYLLTGPRGVGKTTVARLLAKAVNCTAAQDQRPCGVCESCRAIADGRAVDVIEMDAASHTSVDDAREIIERVQFRPTSGNYKVYIVDEAHMLSTAAFNALLKTLEEPPDHALFILATTESHKVPATILSRCQRFTFNRHTVAATAEHIRRIAETEQIALEPGVAEAIARAATGSMRDALSVLDQLMSYGSGTIRLEQVRGLIGATEAQEVTALVDALIGGDLTGALRAVAAVARQGADLRQFARDLVELLRALMLLKAGGDPELLDTTDDALATLQAQAAAGDLAAFLSWVKLFSGLDYQLRTSPYGQLPLELAVVEAIAMPATSAQAAARPAAPTPRPAPPAQPTPRAAPTMPSAQSPRKPAEPAPEKRPARVPAASPAERPATVEPLAEPDAAAAAPASSARPLAEAAAPALAHQQPGDPADDLEQPLADDEQVIAEQWLETHWEEIVYNVRPYNVSLPALLRGCTPGEIEGNTAKIWVKHSFHKQKLEQRQNIDLLERIIADLAGQRLLVQFEMFSEQDILSSQQRRKQRTELRKDPFISAAVRIFDADIENIEPFSDER
jgi:DNA polymerase-3 subunit gamma/tau